MALFFDLLALAAGLLLVAAAFVYLVDQRQAQQLLRRFRLPLLAVVAVFVAGTVLSAGDLWPVLIGLAGASVVAYFIRESRKTKRQHRQSFGGAERKPVLPATESQPAKDQDEQ